MWDGRGMITHLINNLAHNNHVFCSVSAFQAEASCDETAAAAAEEEKGSVVGCSPRWAKGDDSMIEPTPMAYSLMQIITGEASECPQTTKRSLEGSKVRSPNEKGIHFHDSHSESLLPTGQRWRSIRLWISKAGLPLPRQASHLHLAPQLIPLCYPLIGVPLTFVIVSHINNWWSIP